MSRISSLNESGGSDSLIKNCILAKSVMDIQVQPKTVKKEGLIQQIIVEEK